MSTPMILDFDLLLRPIADDRPAGVALKEDERLRGVYQAVKDARESARTAEKKLYQATWLEDADAAKAERPDWKKVHDLATAALAEHSKDLWIAAWLIEAVARLHGFAGLRDGFRLTRELVDRFWDGIHPRPDEDGLSTTVAQLTGLNGSESEGALLAPIDHIPITASGGKIRPLSHADYKQAVELDKLGDMDKRAQRMEKGAVSLAMFDQAVRETPAEFFRGVLDDLQQAIDEFIRLGESLESRCGGESAAPPTSAIRAALSDVRDRVQQLASSVLGDATPAGTTEQAGTATNPGGSASSGAGNKKGLNREEAFRQLLQVAEFFRVTEPHSPVSYALEQAVRWGRMPLPELLSELIGDSNVRDDLFKRVGLNAPRDAE